MRLVSKTNLVITAEKRSKDAGGPCQWIDQSLLQQTGGAGGLAFRRWHADTEPGFGDGSFVVKAQINGSQPVLTLGLPKLRDQKFAADQ